MKIMVWASPVSKLIHKFLLYNQASITEKFLCIFQFSGHLQVKTPHFVKVGGRGGRVVISSFLREGKVAQICLEMVKLICRMKARKFFSVGKCQAIDVITTATFCQNNMFFCEC